MQYLAFAPLGLFVGLRALHLYRLRKNAESTQAELKSLQPFVDVAAEPGTTFARALPAEWFGHTLPKEQLGKFTEKSWQEVDAKFRDVKAAVQAENPRNAALALYFVRHAEGTHNVAERRFGSEYWENVEALKEDYFDAELSQLGMAQCERLRVFVDRALAKGMKIDAIVCSPLTRAIVTAQIVFRSIFDKVPVFAVENARETIGKNTCDRRRTLSNLRALYPGVDFSLMKDEEDKLFTPVRETEDDRRRRAGKLLNFLTMLSERYPRIAVAAHGGVLRGLCEYVVGPVPSTNTGDGADAKSASATHQYDKPKMFEPGAAPRDQSFTDAAEDDSELWGEGVQPARRVLARRGSMSHFEIDNCELIPFFVAKRVPASKQ